MVLYRLQSNSWSCLFSVATVRVNCSGSSMLSWHHGFDHLPSLPCRHTGLFSHTDSFRPPIDILRVPISAVFSTPLTCLHWSIDEFSSTSAVLFAMNIFCLLSNNLADSIFMPASLWKKILPPPASLMASSALQIAGISFFCEESVSPLTARYYFDYLFCLSILKISFQDVVLITLIKLSLCCVSSAYLLRCFCWFDNLIDHLSVYSTMFLNSFFLAKSYLEQIPLWESLLLKNIVQLTWFINPMSLLHQIGLFGHFGDEWLVHRLFGYLSCVLCWVSLVLSRINVFLNALHVSVGFLNCCIKRVLKRLLFPFEKHANMVAVNHLYQLTLCFSNKTDC